MTYGYIIAGVEGARSRLRTDVLDIVHLHSCPLETLKVGDVIAALSHLHEQGKIRAAAYSGENAELSWAIKSGHFGSVACSVNLFGQGPCIPHCQPLLQREWALSPNGCSAMRYGDTRSTGGRLLPNVLGADADTGF